MKRLPPSLWQTLVLVLIVGGVLALALGGFLSPVLNSALSPLVRIQEWISTQYSTVIDFLTFPRDVAALRQRNVDLELKVAGLETQVIQLQQQLQEAQVLYALFDFARSRTENQYKAVAVIGRDPVPFLRYVQIDKGSDDEIRHGMPVITQQGLIGKVDAVTAGAARVQLITDAGSGTSAHVAGYLTAIPHSAHHSRTANTPYAVRWPPSSSNPGSPGVKGQVQLSTVSTRRRSLPSRRSPPPNAA